MIPFTDAFIDTQGSVTVTTWQNIDDEAERPEVRRMSVEAFRAEFPDVPLAEGLFA